MILLQLVGSSMENSRIVPVDELFLKPANKRAKLKVLSLNFFGKEPNMPHTNTLSNLETVTLVRTQTGGPGPRLRAAREALGLGVNDIAKRMRLQEHVIHQIEQDIYDENTALVFVKGYLRSYAALVGLNADQIIQDFISMGLSEDRDAPDLSKLIKKSDKPRRMNLPLNLQSNPAVIWSCVAGTAVAIVGIMWAYSGSITSFAHHAGATMAAAQEPTSISVPIAANPAPVEAATMSAIPVAPQVAEIKTEPKTGLQAKTASATMAAPTSGTQATATTATPGSTAAAAAPASQAQNPNVEPLLF
jgi:cytoskeleton protein RodZ